MEVTPEQRAERSVAHNDSLSFEPAYHNFSNEYQGEDVENTSQLDYSPLTGEPGYFIDATGGHAEMGTYSMIFVATPRPDPDDWWDDFLRNPIVNFVASFTPLTAIALAATKRLSGHTLKTGDYVSVVLAALQLAGKLKMPTSEADAVAEGNAAKSAAEAEALAANPALQGTAELARIGEVAFEAQKALSLAGVGMAGLTAKQTVSVVRAIGAENPGAALISGFGDTYFTEALSKVGIDTSSLSLGQREAVTEIATNMLDGDDFATASAGVVADGKCRPMVNADWTYLRCECGKRFEPKG